MRRFEFSAGRRSRAPETGETANWVLFLAGVGGFAIGSVLVGLFFGLGRRPHRLRLTERCAVGSREFLAAAGGAVNAAVQRGGSAELLNNGDAFFPRMLEDISAARRSVNFLVYIWDPGEVSDRMFDVLVGRARAGVQVRLLLDAFGALHTPKDGLDRLREAGGRVEFFRPVRFGMLTRIHKRNHRRAIVIDGMTGYTGGAAIGDKWLGRARDPHEWRDIMVRVTGCLAVNLQSAFAEAWAASTGEMLVGDAFYPQLGGDDPEQMGDDAIRHISVISSPTSEEHPLRHFYVLSFLAAQERLYLMTPYFVPDSHMLDALIDRGHAGVDVRLLLPNEHTDAKPIRFAAHGMYQKLLESGVRVYEYQPSFLHAKAVVIDGIWSIVGSANIDIRSKELNEENALGILDPGFGASLERTFLEDLGRAREIRLADWRRRGHVSRGAERLAAVFAEQF
jgi:cardiolipin synthase